jgi:hypothetical protein
MTDKITAPFTPAQVDALNRYQRLGYVHEFTCPNDHKGADRTLVATIKGWLCPHCYYTQSWAHAAMTGEPPPNPVANVMAEQFHFLCEAVKTARGCFAAAEIEGLSEAIAETTDERLRDLLQRRVMCADETLAATGLEPVFG